MKRGCIKCIVAGAVAAATLGMGMNGAAATSASTLARITQKLGNDMSAISTAAYAEDTDSLATACEGLTNHANLALTYTRPRGSTKAGWRHVRSGMALLSEAGNLCESGALTLDADKIQQSTELMQEANTEITLATKLLKG